MTIATAALVVLDSAEVEGTFDDNLITLEGPAALPLCTGGRRLGSRDGAATVVAASRGLSSAAAASANAFARTLPGAEEGQRQTRPKHGSCSRRVCFEPAHGVTADGAEELVGRFAAGLSLKSIAEVQAQLTNS